MVVVLWCVPMSPTLAYSPQPHQAQCWRGFKGLHAMAPEGVAVGRTRCNPITNVRPCTPYKKTEPSKPLVRSFFPQFHEERMHMKKPHQTDLDRDLELLGLSREKLATAAAMPLEAMIFSAEELELPENGPAGQLPPARPIDPATTPKPTTGGAGASGTTHTTIRIPTALLEAYKAKATSLGIGYQTLIKRVLQDAWARS